MVSRIKLGIWEAEEFEQDLASRHTTFGRSTSASDMQRKGNRHSEEHNKQGEVSSRNSTDKSRICYTVIILLRLKHCWDDVLLNPTWRFSKDR